ncbi:hypothetical protein AG1IA_00080 [Rhizoctonia solani AG-1 IA]|uniref:Uncharacterized protein n=1 Tax=Thanatephorus cucumeris (strain AG1-IA) TaxID=983506 RepID=L8XB31_THACA|nr:hypothetical protein AG1IA_00080 [Rhizoctonia solani AG-1 IA]
MHINMLQLLAFGEYQGPPSSRMLSPISDAIADEACVGFYDTSAIYIGIQREDVQWVMDKVIQRKDIV